MVIGLYDVDLWHSKTSYPNLELMQTYRYLHDIGHRVIMMKPGEDEGRFTKIFYFKEQTNSDITKDLVLYGEKKSIFGYGFYKTNKNIKPAIMQKTPSYTPYDAYSNKLAIKNFYDNFKKDSYIRLETNNLIDLKEDRKTIYFADNEFLYLDKSFDFLEDKYRNHNFGFAHPLKIKDEETLRKFYKFLPLFKRRALIDFNYSEDFFYEFCNDQVVFIETKKENESQINYLIKITKMGMWAKNQGFYFEIPKASKGATQDEIYIKQWINNSTKESFMKYYNEDVNCKKILLDCDSELRLLLKTDPSKITKKSLDLQSNLTY